MWHSTNFNISNLMKRTLCILSVCIQAAGGCLILIVRSEVREGSQCSVFRPVFPSLKCISVGFQGFSDDHLRGKSGVNELLTLRPRDWLWAICPLSFHLSICLFFSFMHLLNILLCPGIVLGPESGSYECRPDICLQGPSKEGEDFRFNQENK